MPFPKNLPPHDQLADEHDEDGWDRELHGRMCDHADDGDVIAVEVHTGHEVEVTD